MNSFLKQAADNSYAVKVSPLLQDNQVVQIHDTLIIPENMIYKLIFINGVDDESLDMACRVALDRIMATI